MSAETHLHSSDHTSAFEAEDDDQVMQYATPSALAIISLLLGLAAPLGFVAPLLLVIPVFGAVLALVALRRISTSDGALIGRRAAIIGLALCVAAGVAAVSRTQIVQRLRSSQAQALVGQWIELVKGGQSEPAFRLTYRGASPEAAAPPGMPGEPAETIDPLQQFKDDPAIKAIDAAGQEAEVRWVEDLAYQARSGGGYLVQQRYQILPASDATSSEPLNLIVAVQLGRIGGEANSRWLIGSYTTGDAFSNGNVVE